MPLNDKMVSVAISHDIMLTVKLAHRFSDKVYGLIIPCSHKGTADRIITMRM